MSSFRPHRGNDRGSGGYYRSDHIKSGPPPPPVLNNSSGRPAERHYNNERHRSRSPVGVAHHAASRDGPVRHQEPMSRPPPPPQPPRHDDHSQRQRQRIVSSRRVHSPQVGSARYQDQPQPSSREHSSRQAEPTKRTSGTTSRRSPSPHSTRKQTSSGTSTAKSSKPKTSHDSNSHSGQGSSTAPGHTLKSSRSSIPKIQESIQDIINNPADVIREILNPNDVKIPRRTGEGVKPIFDRDELRESIVRRIKAGDTEQNPVVEPIEQRVVAIIREPVIIDPYAATSTPSSSSKKHSQNEAQSSRPRHRVYSPELLPTAGTTSSGVPYRINAPSPPPYTAAKRPRSLSPARPPPPERERNTRFDTDRRRERDHVAPANFGGESSRDFNHSRRERSRSRSPVDRVRRVTLNPSPGPAFGERDLRERLSGAPKADHLAPVSREFLESRGTFRGRGFSRGGFTRRPRGVFISRGRALGRRVEPLWQHDKFERDGDSGNPA